MKDRYAGVQNQFAMTEILAFCISIPVRGEHRAREASAVSEVQCESSLGKQLPCVPPERLAFQTALSSGASLFHGTAQSESILPGDFFCY